MNQNHFEHNSNYSGFDQPPQHFINHQEDLNQQGITDVHDRWDKLEESHNELLNTIQSFCEKFLQQKQAASIDQSPLQERSIQEMEDLKQHYLDEMEYLENSSNAITPVLPTEESDNSLSMGDEHLSTIPEMESDKIIKSSVENLVPIPSESKGISDDTCDVPFCDNSPPLEVLNDHFEIFSNFNNDCTSSDEDSFEDIDYVEASPPDSEYANESLSDEDVPKDVKIYSNPLFEFDDEYISSDVNPLFDEVLEDIECHDSYDFNLDESTFLVTPLFDSNEDECLAPSDVIELLLHRDPSTPTISVVSILEGFTDEPPLEENDDLFDLESKENEWKKILYDAPIDDLMNEDKVFDPGIWEIIFSPKYVKLPFEDRHYLSLTYVIRNFLPYFTYSVDSFLLSSGSEDTIFDPSIPIFSLEPVVSHRSGTFMCFNVYLNILNESP
ncbi:hypothetical protein Tco_0086383, partial [Tanacetum coccineum]